MPEFKVGDRVAVRYGPARQTIGLGSIHKMRTHRAHVRLDVAYVASAGRSVIGAPFEDLVPEAAYLASQPKPKESSQIEKHLAVVMADPMTQWDMERGYVPHLLKLRRAVAPLYAPMVTFTYPPEGPRLMDDILPEPPEVWCRAEGDTIHVDIAFCPTPPPANIDLAASMDEFELQLARGFVKHAKLRPRDGLGNAMDAFEDGLRRGAKERAQDQNEQREKQRRALATLSRSVVPPPTQSYPQPEFGPPPGAFFQWPVPRTTSAFPDESPDSRDGSEIESLIVDEMPPKLPEDLQPFDPVRFHFEALRLRIATRTEAHCLRVCTENAQRPPDDD